MKRSNRFPLTGFTLLELVVVLAILAIVTGLAVRALDGVEDQRRFEASLRDFEQLSQAVLGSPDDRNIDGTRMVSGFVTDMGRLPHATAEGGSLTLRELWASPGEPYTFKIRPAIAVHGIPEAIADPQVLVPGGWRGPYLRLPIGAVNLLDAWGNPMVSPNTTTPANPDTTGFARLRRADDTPITDVDQEIHVVHNLGANGRLDPADTGYDTDTKFVFDEHRAALTTQVEVLVGEGSTIPSGSYIVVRVFSPNPENPALIRVFSSAISFGEDENPARCDIPLDAGLTMGLRVVRAYLYTGPVEDATGTESLSKSRVKLVTLRPGDNFLQLTIEK